MYRIRVPDEEDVKSLAAASGLTLHREEVALLTKHVADAVKACAEIDGIPSFELPVEFPREPGAGRPPPEQDPHNAWAWKSTIRGADAGILKGRSLVMKDCIPVAGMPMTNGTPLLRGYVPDVDAVVVTRVLREGGTIVGGAVCEDLCLAGASNTAATGIVSNPHGENRSAGGSSSGVAALIGSNECDAGIGGDQGGSVRMPSSFCGIVGLKPTWGLVPNTGSAGLDPSVDSLGPMGKTVEDVARVLEAIAGADDASPHYGHQAHDYGYVDGLAEGVEGLKVGVLAEGFGWPDRSDPGVDSVVRGAANSFRDMGATVEDVSVPAHRASTDIGLPLILQGVGETMGRSDGIPLGVKGYYNVGLAQAYAKGWRVHSDSVWPLTKLAIIYSEYMRRRYGSEYYGKAQNRALHLRQEYDKALTEFDLLVTPTTMITAPELPAEDAPLSERMEASFNAATFGNTMGANLTGHPAISVPAGFLKEMPVGMQLIGRRWEDGLLLRAAQAFESLARS